MSSANEFDKIADQIASAMENEFDKDHQIFLRQTLAEEIRKRMLTARTILQQIDFIE